MIKKRIDAPEGDTKIGQGVVALNEDNFLMMVGFSCYAYEGIGVVMPIMQATAVPEKFAMLLTAALATLTFIYIFFAELCYTTLGNPGLAHNFITEELD